MVFEEGVEEGYHHYRRETYTEDCNESGYYEIRNYEKEGRSVKQSCDIVTEYSEESTESEELPDCDSLILSEDEGWTYDVIGYVDQD